MPLITEPKQLQKITLLQRFRLVEYNQPSIAQNFAIVFSLARLVAENIVIKESPCNYDHHSVIMIAWQSTRSHHRCIYTQPNAMK